MNMYKNDRSSLKTIRTEDKPFKCSVCDFSTAKKASLTVHQRIHTGEKPFKCTVYGMQWISFKECSYDTHGYTHGRKAV